LLFARGAGGAKKVIVRAGLDLNTKKGERRRRGEIKYLVDELFNLIS
jgi:hypothetical protein